MTQPETVTEDAPIPPEPAPNGRHAMALCLAAACLADGEPTAERVAHTAVALLPSLNIICDYCEQLLHVKPEPAVTPEEFSALVDDVDWKQAWAADRGEQLLHDALGRITERPARVATFYMMCSATESDGLSDAERALLTTAMQAWEVRAAEVEEFCEECGEPLPEFLRPTG